MRFWLSLLLPVLLLNAPAHGIGIRTHAEMGERAMDDYLLTEPEAMLPGSQAFFGKEQNRRALFSGAAWTDWGYGGINQEAGEDGHWFPFLNAYSALLKERYPTPWTPEAEREIAFFLGTLCHSITDLPWHFGDAVNPSFIQAATAGDGSGHSECDFGSDIFTHTSQTLNPAMGFDDFFFPVDTIYDAYLRFGHAPSRAQLALGATRQRTVWLTGQTMAWTLLASQRAKSPWVFAHLEDYYFGGVRSNAAAAAHWFRYYYAFLHGWACLQQSPAFANGPPGYVPYSGVEDATLLERYPDHNTGREPYLGLAGNGPGDRREARLRFDLKDTGLKSVSKATLWLYVAKRDTTGGAGDKVIACYAAPVAWNAGGQVSDPVDGDEGLVAAAGELTWAGLDLAANGVHTHGPALLLAAGLLVAVPLARRTRL